MLKERLLMKNIAVIGAGTMGAQIAMVCALTGHDVVLNDIDEASLQKGKAALEKQMNRRIEKGRMKQEQVDEAFAKINFTTDLNEVKDVDLVVEAIVEKLDVKRELFAKLDEITRDDTILATNSSTIVSSKIADVTNNP